MPSKKAAPKKTTVRKAAIKPVVSSVPDHTHAMLVALAYLIGFVTAYIAFALNDVTYKNQPTKTNETLVTQEAVAYSAVRAVTTDEGLFMTNNGHQRIISAKLAEGELSFGYHRDITSASVSPDSSMIHYCAVMSEEDSCSHFVYVLSEDKVYPISSAGQQLNTGLDMADESKWTGDNRLQIGGYSSVNSETPWVVQ